MLKRDVCRGVTVSHGLVLLAFLKALRGGGGGGGG